MIVQETLEAQEWLRENAPDVVLRYCDWLRDSCSFDGESTTGQWEDDWEEEMDDDWEWEDD